MFLPGPLFFQFFLILLYNLPNAFKDGKRFRVHIHAVPVPARRDHHPADRFQDPLVTTMIPL